MGAGARGVEHQGLPQRRRSSGLADRCGGARGLFLEVFVAHARKEVARLGAAWSGMLRGAGQCRGDLVTQVDQLGIERVVHLLAAAGVVAGPNRRLKAFMKLSSSPRVASWRFSTPGENHVECGCLEHGHQAVQRFEIPVGLGSIAAVPRERAYRPSLRPRESLRAIGSRSRGRGSCRPRVCLRTCWPRALIVSRSDWNSGVRSGAGGGSLVSW